MQDCKKSVELFSGMKRQNVCTVSPVELTIMENRYGDIPIAEAIRLERKRQSSVALQSLKKRSRDAS